MGVVQRPSWEKHTKGIGFGLLEKMGFKGRLGKDETGVTAALEVSFRTGNRGLGYDNNNKKNELAEAKEAEIIEERKRGYARLLEEVEAARGVAKKRVLEAKLRLEAEASRGRELRRELKSALDAVSGTGWKRQLLAEAKPTPASVRAVRDAFGVDAMEVCGVASLLRSEVARWDPFGDPMLPARLRVEWGDAAIKFFAEKRYEALSGAVDWRDNRVYELCACFELDARAARLVSSRAQTALFLPLLPKPEADVLRSRLVPLVDLGVLLRAGRFEDAIDWYLDRRDVLRQTALASRALRMIDDRRPEHPAGSRE
ncbi:hypothetical protein CTAYLR_000577 [Chrysophaeum taylorii]|uniref:G-patch domain-containing protein n=1 Tax=Chrysophaeum taylorii TaxID=2483200 RepID=A0AAD7UIQ1_9STRA|nr:hypothetical protein CTAYLR_000577 [Chrysophaeum taylorii]